MNKIIYYWGETVNCTNKYKSGKNIFKSILYNLHLTLFLSLVDLRLFYSVTVTQVAREYLMSKFLFIKHTFCIFISILCLQRPIK